GRAARGGAAGRAVARAQGGAFARAGRAVRRAGGERLARGGGEGAGVARSRAGDAGTETEVMSALDPELLAVFLPEARGYLATLEASGDADARARAAHGLKGACSMVGLGALAGDARALEEAVRAGRPIDAALRQIAAALDALAGPPSDPRGSEWDPDELRGLRAFFLDEAREHLESLEQGIRQLRGEPGDRAALASMLRKLHTFKGSAGSVELPALSHAAHALEDRLIALRDGGRPVEPRALAELEAGVEGLANGVTAVEREVRASGRPPAEPPPQPSHSDRRLLDRRVDADTQTVRVEVERIDELMDAASELVFDRTRIVRRLQELDGCVRDVGKVRGALNGALAELESLLRAAPEVSARFVEISTELESALASLGRAVAGAAEDAEGLQRTSATLQEGIRRVRMMAVGRLFARLDQPVRELARKEGKQVRIATAGEETEIDKAVVERVAEPLLHLLRNAIAHGIEPPEVRRALGKPAAGTIELTARHEGDAIQIQESDDGQGIDLQAVRRALVTARRVSEEEAAQLDEVSLFATLFEPGLSTRAGADDL